MDCSPPGSSVGFSRQEYWSRLPFPSPGYLLSPRIEPGSPALQVDSLPPDPPGKPNRRNQRDRELEGDRETEKNGNRDKEAGRKREEEG